MTRTRQRAAHLFVVKDGGVKVYIEVFSQEDISSRLCASRARYFRQQGWSVERHDFTVGSANDPAILRSAVDLVVADQQRSFPEFTRHEAVADARNTLVLSKKDWAPGATVLNGDPSDPLFRAYQTVLKANKRALRFIGALAPAESATPQQEAPASAYCVQCHKDDLPTSLLCDREEVTDLGADREPSLVARYEGRCLRCCSHNHA